MSLFTHHSTYSPYAQEFSRQVSYAEGQSFAKRMNSLFIEASAKTSIGVKEAFDEVVAKIIDTPELWANVGMSSKAKVSAGRGGNANRTTTGVDAQPTSMPGSINLSEGREDEGYGGGCGC